MLEEEEEAMVLVREGGACRGCEVMVGEAVTVDRTELLPAVGGLADIALPDRP